MPKQVKSLKPMAPIDWDSLLVESDMSRAELYSELSEYFYLPGKNGFGKWLRGERQIPDVIYGYLICRFF